MTARYAAAQHMSQAPSAHPFVRRSISNSTVHKYWPNPYDPNFHGLCDRALSLNEVGIGEKSSSPVPTHPQNPIEIVMPRPKNLKNFESAAHSRPLFVLRGVGLGFSALLGE